MLRPREATSRAPLSGCMLRREMWRRWHARDLLAFFLAFGTFASCASDEEGNFFDVGGGFRDASVQPDAPRGSAGTSHDGTCIAEFCPVYGPGAACCISESGPCGMDNGMGCRQLTSSDR